MPTPQDFDYFLTHNLKAEQLNEVEVDRTFEPLMQADGRGCGKGRFTIGIATARTQVAVGQ